MSERLKYVAIKVTDACEIKLGDFSNRFCLVFDTTYGGEDPLASQLSERDLQAAFAVVQRLNQCLEVEEGGFQ